MEFDEERQTGPAERLSVMVELDVLDQLEARGEQRPLRRIRVRDEEIEIDPRFAGPDYGLPDEATVAAIRTAARLEAMLTDPVYEGKSMAGLIAMARSGEIPKDAKVLYVHLGGAPALNAYHKAFQ